MSVDVVKCQCSSQSLENIGMQGQTVNALKQGLNVGRALLLLLWSGLFDRPLYKLLNAAATEVPQRAVQWVHHSILENSHKEGLQDTVHQQQQWGLKNKLMFR